MSPEPNQTPRQPLGVDATLLPSPPLPARPGINGRFGDYDLLEELARGGMGIVFKARQTKLERIVALKMILSGRLAAAGDVERFRREALAAARLQHANIVAIHDVGEVEGQHYFSMDFVDGDSLAALVREQPLTPTQAIGYVRDVARAIQYAHEQGVLHRDLKPSNVLLDRQGAVKVTDFGLAKLTQADSGLTDTGAVLGTPSYMPPEQASGDAARVGPPSDVYSLGAVLYELVTGRPPFRAATALDTILQVIGEQPAPPRLLNPAISRDLETVILKCLEKAPERRYPSAASLADDLQALLDGRAVKARRPGVAERLRRFAGRHRRSVTLGAASVTFAALLVGLVAFLSQQVREARTGALHLGTGGTPHLAELLDDEARLVTAPFSLTRPDPVHVPEGEYTLRLTGWRRLSEEYRAPVHAGERTGAAVDLSERLLWPPLSLRKDDFFLVPGLAGHDLVRRAPFGMVQRFRGVDMAPLWSFQPTAENVPAGWLPQGGEGAAGREVVRRWEECIERSSGLRLMPPRDLDGDGVADLVLAQEDGPVLLALSGRTGKPLWGYWPSLSGAPPKLGRGMVRSLPLGSGGRGPPVWAGPEGQFVALFAASHAAWRPNSQRTALGPPEVFAQAVDATRGRPAWRFALSTPRPGPESGLDTDLDGPIVTTVAGQQAVVCRAGKRLVTLNVATGKEVLPPLVLEHRPWRRPIVADLDGDGRPELLVVNANPVELVVYSLASGKPLWRRPFVKARVSQIALGRPSPEFLDPVLADLDGDGRPEVIVRAEDWGVAVLEGATGRGRWQSPPPPRQVEWGPARFLVGPDLNGDGSPELFLVNAERTSTSRPLTFTVQALSGRTGQSLWSRRLKAPDPVAPPSQELPPLFWWHPGADGWPVLVVPARHTLFLSAGNGRVVHVAEELSHWLSPADLDGDGLPELLAFEPDPSRPASSTGELFAFQARLPQRYQLLGEARVVGDLDGDGVPELVRNRGQVLSGATGRPMWRLWEGGFGVEPLAAFTHPRGRALLATGSFRGPAQLIALDGVTGRRLWVQTNTDVDAPNGIQFHLARALSSGGQGPDDLLAVYSVRRSMRGPDEQELAWLDGATGRVRRRIPLGALPPCDLISKAPQAQLAFVDVTGDGARDVVFAFREPGDKARVLVVDSAGGPVQVFRGPWAVPGPFDTLEDRGHAVLAAMDGDSLVLFDGAHRRQVAPPGRGALRAPRLVRTPRGIEVVVQHSTPTGDQLLWVSLAGKIEARVTLPQPRRELAQTLAARGADAGFDALVCFDDGHLLAFGSRNRKPLWRSTWRARSGHPLTSLDAVQSLPGTVLVHEPSTPPRVCVLDARTGHVIWRYSGPGTVLSLAAQQGRPPLAVIHFAASPSSTPLVRAVECGPTAPDGTYRWPARGAPADPIEDRHEVPLPWKDSLRAGGWEYPLFVLFLLTLSAAGLVLGWRCALALTAAYALSIGLFAWLTWQQEPPLASQDRYSLERWYTLPVFAGAVMNVLILVAILLWALARIWRAHRYPTRRPTISPNTAATDTTRHRGRPATS